MQIKLRSYASHHGTAKEYCYSKLFPRRYAMTIIPHPCPGVMNSWHCHIQVFLDYVLMNVCKHSANRSRSCIALNEFCWSFTSNAALKLISLVYMANIWAEAGDTVILYKIYMDSLPLRTHICVAELGTHWSGQRCVTCAAPGHCLNQW